MACRGRNAHPHRLHPPQGWPPRPPLVGARRCASLLAAGKERRAEQLLVGAAIGVHYLCAQPVARVCTCAGLGGWLEERLTQQRVNGTACARRRSAVIPCGLTAAAEEPVFNAAASS